MTTPATSPADASDAPTFEEGFFDARDRRRLYWQSYRPAETQSHVIFVHGYGDHSSRYRHLFDFLARRGHAVHAYDTRGHGRSSGKRGHVDRFEEYLDELTDFVAFVQARHPDAARPFLAAHSHGGLVTLRWLLRGAPAPIAGLALSSPFLGLAFEPPRVKVTVSRLLGRVVPWLPVPHAFDPGELTSDAGFQDLAEADLLRHGVTTPGWFNVAMVAQEEVRAGAGRIEVPVLLMQAGADRVADPAVSRRVFDALGSQDKAFESYEGFCHELFMESGRERPMHRLAEWLEARAASEAGA
jgi:lysophospholipase